MATRGESVGRKTRAIVAIVAVAVFSATFVSSAWGARYAGQIKGVPGSTMYFDVLKSADGPKFIPRFEFKGFMYHCDDGSTEGETYATGYGELEGKSFDWSADFGSSGFRFEGALGKKGKATGTFRYWGTYEEPTGECNTGRLNWVAKKV